MNETVSTLNQIEEDKALQAVALEEHPLLRSAEQKGSAGKRKLDEWEARILGELGVGRESKASQQAASNEAHSFDRASSGYNNKDSDFSNNVDDAAYQSQ